MSLKLSVKSLLCGFVALLSVSCLNSCADDNPYLTPQTALDYALDSLYAHNYGAYIRSVAQEDGGPIFSKSVMRNLLQQHIEAVEAEKGSVFGVDVEKTDTLTDSLVVVFYKLTFSNGNSEVSSQKVMCQNGEWKLKLRY
jgi:hypothetical protein